MGFSSFFFHRVLRFSAQRFHEILLAYISFLFFLSFFSALKISSKESPLKVTVSNSRLLPFPQTVDLLTLPHLVFDVKL